MQTIEEYKAYTKQLEGEVSKWHHAYDALVIERNQLVNHLKSTEKFLKAEREECNRWRQRATNLCENKKIIETMAAELDELRKHEVEWDLSKARIKELESQLKQNQGEKQDEKQDENPIP